MNNLESDTQRLIDYMLENAPCKRDQLCNALELDVGTVSSILEYLKGRGIVQRILIKKTGFKQWELTPEYQERDAPPARPRVTNWDAKHQRDPLTAAFFGPAREAA